MSNWTTVSPSRYFKTYCSPMILRELIQLNRGEQRLLIILLSKLSKNKTNKTSYLNRTVRLSFEEYCAAIQQPYNDKMHYVKVRNVFYNLKKDCRFIVAEDSRYSEDVKEVIVAFTEEFYLKLREAKSILIPQALFAVERGKKMPSYTLTMAIYYRKHISEKNKVKLSVREIIKLCGGSHTDYENKQKYWRNIYVAKIRNALLTLKSLGIIATFRYKLGKEEAIDPKEYNKYLDDDVKDPKIGNGRKKRVDNFDLFTRYYRTFLDVDIEIVVEKMMRRSPMELKSREIND